MDTIHHMKRTFLNVLLLSSAVMILCSCASVRKKNIKIPTVELASVCSRVDEQNRVCDCSQQYFSCAEDKFIYGCLSLRYVNKVHDVVFEWYGPDNSPYHITEPIELSEPKTKHEQILVYQRLDITKMDELGITGNWRVIMKLDNEIVNIHSFTLVK